MSFQKVVAFLSMANISTQEEYTLMTAPAQMFKI